MRPDVDNEAMFQQQQEIDRHPQNRQDGGGLENAFAVHQMQIEIHDVESFKSPSSLSFSDLQNKQHNQQPLELYVSNNLEIVNHMISTTVYANAWWQGKGSPAEVPRGLE